MAISLGIYPIFRQTHMIFPYPSYKPPCSISFRVDFPENSQNFPRRVAGAIPLPLRRDLQRHLGSGGFEQPKKIKNDELISKDGTLW